MFRSSSIKQKKEPQSSLSVKVQNGLPRYIAKIHFLQVLDFFKAEIIDMQAAVLENNKHLVWQSSINMKTGEIGNYKNAFYKGLEFRIYDPSRGYEKGLILVSGSLHKYYNSGAHNFNDFDTVGINEVLKDLQSKFYLTPANLQLRQLEVGVNIKPAIPTKQILDHCILYKKDRLKWTFVKDEGNYIQARQDRKYFKMYDKLKHYKEKGFDLTEERMRIEVHYSKMQPLNKQGIKTLKDLLAFGLDNLSTALVNEWNQVVFYDYPLLDGTKYESTYSNPNYWLKLSPSNFKYHRANLKTMQEGNPESIWFQVKLAIEEKAEVLTRKTDLLHSYNIGCIWSVEDRAKRDRTCVVTGINIAMQKPGSFHLSHTGIKYYRDTDRKVYNELRRKYLSEKWHSHPVQVQIKELAHNIRNTWNNRRRRERKKYQSQQVTIQEFINQNHK